MNAPSTPQRVAEAVGAAMAERDRLVAGLGLEILEMAPGRTVMRMTVRDPMLNGLDMCHGGVIFSLCDVAFAFACNSHNRNMVAADCTISFLRAAAEGDVLTADARETYRGRRDGIYDITVTNQRGETVAAFRGHARAVPGHMVPQLAHENQT